MNKRFLIFAAVAGALSVFSGAMVAHLLKNQMEKDVLDIYETAVRYQFYHVFALLATGILSEKFSSSYIYRAGNCFIGGIVLFSGSLYCISALLTMKKEIPFLLAIATPAGGFLFILGWIFLSIAIWRKRSS